MDEGKQTLSTKCFEMLTESILNGEILPGERLLCEDLKTRYHVGMSPIREALSKLAATHLVTFEEHKGFSVAKMNAAQIFDHAQTFAEIETLCLKQAIAVGDDLWEGNIVGALYALSKIENSMEIDFFSWSPLNLRFHNALVSACPLKSLMEIRNHLYRRHQWYVLLSYKFADHSIISANHLEHKQIAEAVIARKTKEAIEKSFIHITSGVEDLIAKLISRGLINETR